MSEQFSDLRDGTEDDTESSLIPKNDTNLESLEIELHAPVNSNKSKIISKENLLKWVFYFYLVIKYLIFLYFGPFFYTLCHEFSHAITALILAGCTVDVHIGCIEYCPEPLFHITTHFYVHTL